MIKQDRSGADFARESAAPSPRAEVTTVVVPSWRRFATLVTLGVALGGMPERSSAQEPDFQKMAEMQRSFIPQYNNLKNALQGATKADKEAFLESTRTATMKALDSKEDKGKLKGALDSDSLTALKGHLKLADGATLVSAEVRVTDGKPVLAVQIRDGQKVNSHALEDGALARRVAANQYVKLALDLKDYAPTVKTIADTHFTLLGR